MQAQILERNAISVQHAHVTCFLNSWSERLNAAHLPTQSSHLHTFYSSVPIPEPHPLSKAGFAFQVSPQKMSHAPVVSVWRFESCAVICDSKSWSLVATFLVKRPMRKVGANGWWSRCRWFQQFEVMMSNSSQNHLHKEWYQQWMG